MPGLVSRLPHFLRPAYIDEARFVVQSVVFRRLLEGVSLSGRCLNAGCGEMLYYGWLDSTPGLTHFVHMDLHTAPAKPLYGNQRHEAVPGSLTDLPFPDNSFEFVFCTEVLEHIPDHHQAAAEISRVLTGNGLALISTPTPPAPFDPNHVREGYKLEDMTQLLEAHGFVVEKHLYTFHFLFRALYVVWIFLLRRVGRNEFSPMPRFVLRGWSHLARMLPFGKPWDIAVIARKV